MWADIRILKLLENGKPIPRNEIIYSVREANEVLDRMVTAGLLKFNPATEEYSITKNGIEELQYYRMEREGMKMADAQGMVIET